jgi:hypothetical protein
MPELIRLFGYALFAGGALCVAYVVFEMLLRFVFKDDYDDDAI